MLKRGSAVIGGSGLNGAYPFRYLGNPAYHHDRRVQALSLHPRKEFPAFTGLRAAKNAIGVQPRRKRHTLGSGRARIERQPGTGRSLAELRGQGFIELVQDKSCRWNILR